MHFAIVREQATPHFLVVAFFATLHKFGISELSQRGVTFCNHPFVSTLQVQVQNLHLYFASYFAGYFACFIASFIACLIACLSYFCCYIPTKVGVRQHFCDTPSAYILRSYQLYFNSLRRTKASILSQKSIIIPTEISHIISDET